MTGGLARLGSLAGAKERGEEKRVFFIYSAKFVMITDDLGHALLPYSGYVICCPYVESVSSFLISGALLLYENALKIYFFS